MSEITEKKEPAFTVEWEYYTEDDRVPNNAYDDLYIEAFCNNPGLGKTAAILASGYTGKGVNQMAYRTHKRLQAKIEKRLDDQVLEGAHVGHSALIELCKNSNSDTVKASCAKNLVEMAGRKAREHIVIEESQTDEERDDEIVQLQREIAAQEGKTGHLDS